MQTPLIPVWLVFRDIDKTESIARLAVIPAIWIHRDIGFTVATNWLIRIVSVSMLMP